MSETLILHHYDASPYAEKIRLMFGAKHLRWQSVLSPPQPPRPNVDPLSGGYRRIPIAQIGADVFCDTFVIAQEVARLARAPELDPENASPEAKEILARAEGDVFFAAIGSVAPATLLGTLVRTVGPIGMVRFAIDRAGRVWECRPLAYQGAHVRGHNDGNIGILVMGNFDVQRPSPAQVRALGGHVNALCLSYGIPKRQVHTHRQALRSLRVLSSFLQQYISSVSAGVFRGATLAGDIGVMALLRRRTKPWPVGEYTACSLLSRQSTSTSSP